MAILKVSAHSRPTAVAGAIAGSVRETRRAEVQAIGADAVNQAIKAVAVARGYLEQDNINVICIPTFVDVEIEGEERTAIKLTIEPRDPNAPFAPVFRSKSQTAAQTAAQTATQG